MSMDIIHQTINNQTGLDDFLFVHDDLLLGLSCIPPFFGEFPPKKIRNEPKKKTNNNTHPKTAPKLLEREFLDSTLSGTICEISRLHGVFVVGDLETFRQNTEINQKPKPSKSKSKSPVFLFRNSRRAWVKYVKSFKTPLSLSKMFFHYIYNHIVILHIYISHTFTWYALMLYIFYIHIFASL